MAQYVAGIDEAGLGPMLGPLVVGTCLFRIDAPNIQSLWTALEPLVSRDPKAWREQMVVCDSKQLYSSSRGVGPLEESLLPFCLNLPKWSGLGVHDLNVESFWQAHAMIPTTALDAYPWYSERGLELPVKAQTDRIEIRARQLTHELSNAGIALEEFTALPVLEAEFNRLIDSHGNKADAHASAVAYVLKELWKRAPDLNVFCDRLGARAYYGKMLESFLKPDRLAVVEEGGDTCVYHLEQGERRMKVTFMTKGDTRSFTISLASMLAKYVREISMKLFNAYFTKEQPGLKATAGYVTDARRFLSETSELRGTLGIDDEFLIRKR